MDVLEEKNYLAPAGIPTPDRPAGRLVTIMTELSRLFSLCQEHGNVTDITAQNSYGGLPLSEIIDC